MSMAVEAVSATALLSQFCKSLAVVGVLSKIVARAFHWPAASWLGIMVQTGGFVPNPEPAKVSVTVPDVAGAVPTVI